MRYLAVLGRQPEISKAELSALLPEIRFFGGSGAVRFEVPEKISFNFNRLGGTLKLAEKVEGRVIDFLAGLPEGKITLGVSDYSKGASRKTTSLEALRLKKILVRHGRSVRVVEQKQAELSTATSLHNGLSGSNPKKVELLKFNDEWYRVVFVQDIDAYSRRDQARPARDAFVGMLPPKLAQILINLCGDLPEGSRVLDSFCGTGVVLQEAILMGYQAYGTDLSERMVEYSERNLKWLCSDLEKKTALKKKNNGDLEKSVVKNTTEFAATWKVEAGDATDFKWNGEIDAVACEGYLGRPMSLPPAEIKLKAEKQECGVIIRGFLKNLAGQIKSGTPVVLAAPAWLRENGEYSRLNILDETLEAWYNIGNKSREGLLYHREGQVVARDIIILRKK
ncbi:MAG: DNA methyltransferase [Candidatus Saccharibacteria bacterium]|nr:DNA methyltransferase [Candidatus Saccharibacteria bacterium]